MNWPFFNCWIVTAQLGKFKEPSQNLNTMLKVMWAKQPWQHLKWCRYQIRSSGTSGIWKNADMMRWTRTFGIIKNKWINKKTRVLTDSNLSTNRHYISFTYAPNSNIISIYLMSKSITLLETKLSMQQKNRLNVKKSRHWQQKDLQCLLSFLHTPKTEKTLWKIM